MLRLADDDHRAAVCAVFLHQLVHMRHMRAGAIDHRKAARAAHLVHGRRHAMGTDDDRLAGGNLVKRIHAAHARAFKARNILRIVDQRPEGHAGEPLLRAGERLVHRAADAEAESGVLSNGQFHTLFSCYSGISMDSSPQTGPMLLLPIFMNSMPIRIFLPDFFIFYLFLKIYVWVCSAGAGRDLPWLSCANSASMRPVSVSQDSLVTRSASRSSISTGLPTRTVMRRKGL